MKKEGVGNGNGIMRFSTRKILPFQLKWLSRRVGSDQFARKTFTSLSWDGAMKVRMQSRS